MEQNICKIKIGQEQGTGFFCKIPFPNKNNMLPVLITNNHVIDDKSLYNKNTNIKIDIEEEKESKIIDLKDRIKYIYNSISKRRIICIIWSIDLYIY